MNKFGQTIRTRERDSSGVRRSNLLASSRVVAFTTDGSIDAKNQRLCNLLDPTDPTDAVNKQFLEIQLKEITTKLDNLIKRVDALETWLNSNISTK